MNHIRRYLKLYIFVFFIIAISFAVIFDAQINTFLGSFGDNNQQVQGPIILETLFVQEIKEEQKINEPIVSTSIIDQKKSVFLLTENKEAVIKQLIKAGYTKDSSSIKSQLSGEKLVGATPISLAKNKKLPVSVVLKSTNTLQDKYAEAELPVDIYVKTKNDTSYTKEIEKPKFVDPKQYNLDNKEAVAMIDVGSNLESIFFEDEQGNPKDVTIRMPAPGYSIGSNANIYSSEDGENWNFHTTAQVQEIENSPYVVFTTNHFTLFTVGSIQWDNDNFLTEEFWNENPTDDQIIRALYGDGSGGIERTAYTRYRSEIGCVTGNMSVIYLSGGTGIIPLNLSENIVYVLESGNYISTGVININNCSAIIGKTGNINIYSSIYLSSTSQGLLYTTSKKYSILDNLKINGTGDGQGGSHISNRNGIMYYTISINHSANNIHSYNNNYGIQSNGISSSNRNRNIFLNNIKTYNNTHGIYIQTYNENNMFTNIQSYNNTQRGIYVQPNNNNLIFNNIQSYNNGYNGFELYSNQGSGHIINNAQIYNNTHNGLVIWGNDNILNNIQSYNNELAGIYLSNTIGTKLNDVSVLNNITGIQLLGTNTGLTYYGKLKIQDNNIDWQNLSGILIVGNLNDYNYLGWTGGYIDTDGCFRCSNISNPTSSLSGDFINTGVYRSCNYRGISSSWKSNIGEDVSYIYGTNIPKQIQPVQYYGTEIISSNLSYSSDLYIGEVNNIGENNDTTCNNCEGNYSVTRDNNNFVDSGFWNQNPNSCDIFSALYSTGLYWENRTFYTDNWTSAQKTPYCTIENMQVKYISPGVDTLPDTLISNTVYILSGGDYILSGISEIQLNNCTSIIVKNGTGYFYSTGYVNKYLLSSYWKDNIILQNLETNGTGDGYGGSHNRNSGGLKLQGNSLDRNYNSTIENLVIYNSNYGISSNYMNYNKLNNIYLYNNYYYGLQIQYSDYNIIDNIDSYYNRISGLFFILSYSSIKNIKSYKNGLNYTSESYGIQISSSKNNVFENFEVFNNGESSTWGRGIHLLGTSTGNLFKNGKIYNNTNDGLYLEDRYTTDNYFDTIQIYNNADGIDSFGLAGSNYFNNMQIFNNKNYGINLQGGNYILNNISIYNNGSIGLYILGNSYGNGNNIVNNVSVYNNSKGIQIGNSYNNIFNNVSVLNNTIGINLISGTGHKYYGNLKLQENNIDWEGNSGFITAGNLNDYNDLGWTGGYIDIDGCFRCGNVINPINSISGSFINTGIYRSCNSRGNDASWKSNAGEYIEYIYGINTPKQIQPLEYSGTEIILSNLSYSGDLYIGEVNKVGENDDIGCNNCSGQYSVTWNNNNFVNSGFRDQNPNSCDVISAFYGTGKYPNTTTAYTKNWTGGQTTNFCHMENMRVVDVSPGVDILSGEISSYTIYVLSGGNYILSGVSQLNLNHCSVIVSKNSTGYFYSTGPVSQIFYIYDKNNIVLQNLEINGSGNGFGGSHTKNTRGIYIYNQSAINNVLYNISILNNNNHGIDIRGKQFYIDGLSISNSNNGIYSQGFLNNILNNTEFYNNSNGIYFQSSSSNNLFSGLKIFNNSSRGLFLASNSNNNTFTNADIYKNNDIGIYLNASIYNIFDNVKIYNNNQEGISVSNTSNYTIIKNSAVYNNKNYGINIYNATNALIDNVQTYNNTYEGITINSSLYSTLNNIQSYNNTRIGINIQGNSHYFSLNNILSYNNATNGINISTSNTGILNNIYSYNNFGVGIELYNSSNMSGNNINILNNQKGLYLRGTSTGYLYYGKFSLYDNSIDIDLVTGSLNQGTTNDFGWDQGYFNKISCFRCGNIINPINNLSGFFVNTGIHRSCNFRGNDVSWSPQTGENIGYQYGINVAKQIQPVQYSGTQVIISNLAYSGSLYIGEINKIGENNDTICNNCEGDYSVTWNNDDFIDSGFWDQSPNSCDIASALYGTGLDREDTTSYIQNRTGSMNTAFCDIENMQVVNINSGIDTLPLNLLNYTIYILSGGNYILSGNTSVNLGNCSAIITQNNTGYFYSTGKVAQLLYAKNRNNIILQGLEINGSGNGSGGSHTTNDYGINFDGDNKNNVNSSLYNIGVYNNLRQGIFLRRLMSNNNLINIFIYNNSDGIGISASSNYNTIKNIKSFNNNSDGIELNSSNYNTLDNIETYNNVYGISLASSNYNTIHDIKTYNNTQRGISLQSASYNTIINLESYSNTNEGIYLGASFYNILNNIKSYKNSSRGIIFSTSNYNKLSNFESHNNSPGLYFVSSSNNISEKGVVYNNRNRGINIANSNNNFISYISIFNNTTEGIEISTSQKNTISNNTVFNNTQNGIKIDSNASGNIIQNTSIYNNLQYGINFTNSNTIKGNIINNVNIYNNTSGLYVPYLVTGNYIYNNLNIFSNKISDIVGSGENLILGSGDTYNGFGRTTGNIKYSGSLDRSIFANPKNLSGTYLLSWLNTPWTGMLGYQAGYYNVSGVDLLGISYGYNLPRQIQSVIWSGNQLILSGSYDPNKYIGGNDVALMGTLSGWNSTWHSSLLNLSYLANPGFQYNVFGDIFVTASGEVNTPISLILSQGTGTKTLIGQLFDGNSFTHFVFTSDYVDLPYVDLLDVQNQQIIENELVNGGYVETTGSVKGTMTGYFIGKKDIRLYHSNGELIVPIIMQSTGIELVEVQLSSGTVVKIEDNQTYTGIVSLPIQKNPLESGLSGAIAVISLGSENISLQLKDGENNPISAIIRIPVLAEIDEHMDIYYSENNGSTREFHTGTNVISLSGSSYVEFTTNHFTDFAIVGVGELPPEPLTGSFMINNDESYTLTSVVLLSLDASGATNVRFSNDNENRSEWLSYTGTYEWTLTGDYGTKIVYAEIDFDSDLTGDISTSDSIEYLVLPPGQSQGNIKLEITGGVTECVYGTSLTMAAQEVKIGIPYTFTGTFPSTWYCQDYRGIDGGWSLTIQTTDLRNEKNNVISGNNLLISHDPVVVEGDLACTGYNGTATQFYNAPYEIFEKALSNKICKVSANNVSILVNVPANQAPGNYSGTLTLTMNGF